MILFKKDWLKHPSAIVDTKTKNRSFVRVAGVYRSMGIKNHTFMLSLLDPSLQGVDPHDPDLTNEVRIKIAIETKRNIWYYLREVVKVNIGGKPAPYEANRFNIAHTWLAMSHITTLSIVPRQLGKSFSSNSIDSWVFNIATIGTTMGLLTKDDKLRQKTSLDIREIINSLPPYLKMLSRLDIKNSERMTIRALNNNYVLQVSQKDKRAAANTFRGHTIPIFSIDEIAHLVNITESLPVALAATTTAREIAKRYNQPYYTKFMTTTGKLNTPEGRFAHGLYKAALRWSEKLLDLKDEEELVSVIQKNTGKHKLILLEFNHRQLGKTDEWVKERIEVALSEGDDARSDFFNEWVNGNASSPIPKSLLEIINKSKKTEFNPYISKYGYVVKWYVDNNTLNLYKTTKSLSVGLDTSDALGGDNDDIGLVFRDPSTGAIVGVGKYNETNLATFADFLVEILETFPKAILVPERRSSATAIMDNMFRIMAVKKMNPFKRIYNKIVNNMDKTTDKELLRKTVGAVVPTQEVLNKHKKAFGFATSGVGENSRSMLYGNIFRMVLTYTADKTHDPSLITQLNELVIRNNRIDHSDEGSDDLVIAYLLSMWFLARANNLHVYGLQKHTVLNLVIDNEILSSNPDIDVDELNKQKRLKGQIEDNITLLKAATSELVGIKILNRIRQLQGKLNTKIINTINVESMLEDIKLYRKISKR